jgi:hypothetical protein
VSTITLPPDPPDPAPPAPDDELLLETIAAVELTVAVAPPAPPELAPALSPAAPPPHADATSADETAPQRAERRTRMSSFRGSKEEGMVHAKPR